MAMGLHTTGGVSPHREGEGQGCIRREGASEAAQEPLDRRLAEVAKAVGGGYRRLQISLSLALAVRGTVAGHRLGALAGGWGGGGARPLRMHPFGGGGAKRTGSRALDGPHTVTAQRLKGQTIALLSGACARAPLPSRAHDRPGAVCRWWTSPGPSGWASPGPRARGSTRRRSSTRASRRWATACRPSPPTPPTSPSATPN